VSAFRGDNRDGALGSFIQAARDEVIEVGSYLLVESHDRLSRQPVEVAMQQFLEIINLGVTVVTLLDMRVFRAGELDTFSLMGSLINMSRANEESETKSRRGAAAWQQRRTQARETGSTVSNARLPSWVTRDGSSFGVDEERAGIINQMFEMAKGGAGYAQIAKHLNTTCVQTFGKGEQWRPASIGNFLKSRSVLGEWQPHRRVDGKRVPEGDPIVNYYPQIVAPALFLDVQRQVALRNKHSGSNRSGTYKNLFSGMVVCSCGNRMVHHNKGTSGVDRYYLVCPLSGVTECGAGYILYGDFEPQVLVALSHMSKVMVRVRERDVIGKVKQEQLAEITLKIEKSDRKAVNLAGAIAEGGKLASLVALLASVEAEREALRVEQLAVEEDIEKITLAEQKVQLLSPDTLETTEARQAFNMQLKQSINPMSIQWGGNAFAIVYASLDGELFMEQEFSYKLASSIVRDMDGHIVCCTKAEAPYIDNAWIEGMRSEPDSEPFETVGDSE